MCDVGREPDPKVIKEMLSECPEKLNFTHFLTLFGEKLHGKLSATKCCGFHLSGLAVFATACRHACLLAKS